MDTNKQSNRRCTQIKTNRELIRLRKAYGAIRQPPDERTQIWTNATGFEPFPLYGRVHRCQDGSASTNRLFHLGLPHSLKGSAFARPSSVVRLTPDYGGQDGATGVRIDSRLVFMCVYLLPVAP